MDFDIKRFNGFSENEWILWQSPCLRRKKSPAFLSHFLYVLPLRTLAQRCLPLGVEAGSGCVPRLQRPPSAPLPLRLKDGVCVRKSIRCQCKRDEIYLSQYLIKSMKDCFAQVQSMLCMATQRAAARVAVPFGGWVDTSQEMYSLYVWVVALLIVLRGFFCARERHIFPLPFSLPVAVSCAVRVKTVYLRCQ